jgi:ERCC4-type nuclease
MVESAKSWIRENSTLVYFLIAQVIAIGTAASAIIAYSVKLETRVSIMETRGAEYTVGIMSDMKQRITVLEQQTKQNEASINRIVQQYLKDQSK